MTNKTQGDLLPVEVTQADRLLFKMVVTGMVGPTKHMAIDRGGFDQDARMQYIARHRLQSEGNLSASISILNDQCERLAAENSALRHRLAAQSQQAASAEPVAWMYRNGDSLHPVQGIVTLERWPVSQVNDWTETPLYAAPVQAASGGVGKLRSSIFEVLRRHDVSEQCFAEIAMLTHAALSSAPVVEPVSVVRSDLDFCNKCSFLGTAEPDGAHLRPKDGEWCNYLAGRAVVPVQAASGAVGDSDPVQRAWNWLSAHPGMELSYSSFDEEEWQVHRVTGGRNDREWTLIASGQTALEAVQVAMSATPGEKPEGGA